MTSSRQEYGATEYEPESDGEDEKDFAVAARAADLTWAAVILIENYRYPPAALAREHESNWELLDCEGQVCNEIIDEQILAGQDGNVRERFSFQEVLSDGTALSGTALLLVNATSRKTFSMEMREAIVPEASAHSLTVVLHIQGAVAGQVTNLNVSRTEPRIEVHSGHAFPQFGPLADFTDFRLIPHTQRVRMGLSSLLQQQSQLVFTCVGGSTRSLLSMGGVCEARFSDDGRRLEVQAAAALGVLPSRVRCESDDAGNCLVIVEGEPLEDIGQLNVVGPMSPEVMYTGALEGDVIETVIRGRLAFFLVAPDASFEPRRHRLLESLRKPSETHEAQAAVFLAVQAAAETRYRQLLSEDAKMTPLTNISDAERRAPRRALDRLHSVIGSDAYNEARGSQTLAQAQLVAISQADGTLADEIKTITAGQPSSIWHEDVVLDAVAQGIWHARWGSALARAVHGLPPAMEEDSDNEVPDVLSGSCGEDDPPQSSAASCEAASDTDEEEETPPCEPEGAQSLCARAEETLATLPARDNELQEEHTTYLEHLSAELERRGGLLSAANAAWMQDATRRQTWLQMAEKIDEHHEVEEIPRRVRQEFWKECANKEMIRHIATACMKVDAAVSARVSLRQQLDLLHVWVADNVMQE